MSDKISPQHLARKAILYIRQSSTHQVSHNVESQRLQYAMQDRLHHLGWSEIEVVDVRSPRSGKYVYYHCTDFRGNCDNSYIREERLAELLGDVIRPIQISSDVA